MNVMLRSEWTASDILVYSLGYLLLFFFLFLLIFGLIQSRKNHFMAGFYFFLLILIIKLYDFLSIQIVNWLMDNVFVNGNRLPFEMTMGKLISLVTFVPRILEVTAYSFLVFGLYSLWKTKKASEDRSAARHDL